MLAKRYKKKPSYILVLILVVIMLLSSCVREYCKCIKPVYPIAGKNVAKELEKSGIDEYPYTWEWISRIDKLRQELSINE